MIIVENNTYINKGITLVVLIITIVVALVILSISVVAVKNAVDNANLVAYAKDISSIQDAVANYYITNESFPTTESDATAKSQTTFLTYVTDQEDVINELKENNEYNDNGNLGAFYIIDVSKLDIAKTIRGTKKDGDTKDVYIMSYPSMNLYYAKGNKIKGVYYYSLTPKLTNITKITKSDVVSEVQTVSGITIKRDKKAWTNKLGITIQASIDSGEKLFVKIADGAEREITVTQGMNAISFNSIAELKIKATSITDAEVNSMDNGAVQETKYLEIIKKNGTLVIGSIKVDCSNYEKIAPVKGVEATKIKSQLDNNVVSFKCSDAASGIKEVRYEYLSVFNKKGEIVKYYDGITELDSNYMMSRAKKGTITKDGEVELKIPKDVEGIQILVIDRAGNWINIIQPIYTGTNMFYVGIIPKEISLTKATFRLVFNSSLGINNVVTYISSDGSTYNNPKTFTLNSNNTTEFLTVNDYVGLNGFKDKIYIKALVTDNNVTVNSRIQEQRVFVLTKEDNNTIGTREKNNSTWENPYIPFGFEVTDGSIEEGLVIQDVSNNAQTNGNEFVWIPVKDMSVFKRYTATYNSGVASKIDWTDLTSSTIFLENQAAQEYVEMKNSVQKHGGFYIARYEAGVSKKMPQVKLATDTTTLYATGEYRPVSKKGVPVWNYISWGGISTNTATDGGPGNDLANGAVKVARSMYPNTQKLTAYALPTSLTNYTEVISTLCYDVEWDATMIFLQDVKNMYMENKPYIVDSDFMGNLQDTDSNNNPALAADNGYTQYVTKNIYDLVGNVAERTMGYSNTSGRNFRGGYFTNYKDPSIYSNASSRDSTTTQESSPNLGFRVALYIK